MFAAKLPEGLKESIFLCDSEIEPASACDTLFQ